MATDTEEAFHLPGRFIPEHLVVPDRYERLPRLPQGQEGPGPSTWVRIPPIPSRHRPTPSSPRGAVAGTLP